MVAVNGPYFKQSCPWLPPAKSSNVSVERKTSLSITAKRQLHHYQGFCGYSYTFVIYFQEIKNLCWYLILCISSNFYNIFFPCSIPKLLGVTSRSPVGCRQPRASSREIWPNPVGLAVTSHSWRWSDEWLVNLSTWSEGYSLVCEINHKYP